MHYVASMRAISLDRFLILVASLLLVSGSLAACGSSGNPTTSGGDKSLADDDDEDDDDEADDDDEGDDDEADDDDDDEKPVDAGKKDAGKSTTAKDSGAASKDAGKDAGTAKPATDSGSPTTTGPKDAGAPTATKPDPNAKKPDPSKLPQVKGTCPQMRSGGFNVNGSTGTLWVGPKAGPVVFYWHGTGTSADEVYSGLPGAAEEIEATGGVLASFDLSNGLGDNTGDLVWYTGDIDSADQILACAVEAGVADTSRIYTSGYSAGGLQSGTMVFSRSNYLASAVVYSGGPMLGGILPGSTTFVDPSNVPSTLGAHGAQGADWLVLDFHDGTILVGDTVKMAGGFAIDCDDDGDHIAFVIGIRAGVGGKAWQFLKDHPYNVRPYGSTLPAGYPSYCKIVQ